MHQHKCHLDCEIKILVKASCGFWSNLSGPFITHIEGGMKRSGGGGVSPVVEVTANTSLSALPPQYGIRSQLSQHTHTHLLIRTHMPCMYSMARNDIPTYTHKHTQAAATRRESRTGRHRWSFLGFNCMSSCPQITHTHTNTQVEGTQQSELCIPR